MYSGRFHRMGSFATFSYPLTWASNTRRQEEKGTYIVCTQTAPNKTQHGKMYDDSLEGKMAADPLKNKKMLNKSIHFRSKSFFWCSRCKSVDR
jgi:hypothetical protein